MNNMELNSLLEMPLAELLSLADKVRRDYIGSRFELCSIINAKSGLCSEDCKFCAQSSRHKTDISVYKLVDQSEIVQAARDAQDTGAERFGIVTSGNRLMKTEIDILANAISDIRGKVGIPVCASLGALNKEQLETLRSAGLSRYHHNIETSRNFYTQIVSTHDFQERINTIVIAKDVGLEVCSGGIIGMGETWQDRIDMAMLLKELDVDSVPINLLVPIRGTSLESLPPISCNDAIRTICLFRIVLEDKTIKLVAGRETILKDFQAMAFMAGANGMFIGGYLTVQGRDIEEDHKLVEEIKKLWRQ